MGRTAAQLLHLAGHVDERAASDRALLSEQSEAAFMELVRRHGPLVLGICRRVLRHEQDAEDAFQAAFMVLAKKGKSLREPSVASWLFGVARNVAIRLREKNQRRRRHENEAGLRAFQSSDIDESLAALDEALQRLPNHYRAPLVACFVRGQTQQEAARDLGWSVSTLRRRLDRAMNLLRSRMVAPSVTLAGSTVVVSTALADRTKLAAVAFMHGNRGTVPALLAEGVLSMMARTQFLKVTIGVALTLVGVATLWQVAPGGDRGVRAVHPSASFGQQGEVGQVPPPAKEPPAKADRIKAGDRLQIKVRNTIPDEPIGGVYIVEPAGTISLGPAYGGRVKVAGMTLEEAETLIRTHLEKFLKEPQVSVVREDPPAGRKLEDRVQRLEQEVLELRAAIRELQKKKE